MPVLPQLSDRSKETDGQKLELTNPSHRFLSHQMRIPIDGIDLLRMHTMIEAPAMLICLSQ
jgi:hypothetical protein